MDDENLHELIAPYVLDALDEVELEAFEHHLESCARCRGELAALSEVAGLLAYGVSPAAAPPALRARILEAARAQRASVTALRPRWATPVAVAAAIAACAAAALGAWNVSLHDQLSGERAAGLLEVPLRGASGSVVVSPGGSGALVLSDLAAAPAGRTYEAWVIEGRSVAPAGLFRGGGSTTVVALSQRVPAGAEVAVTLEPEGGTPQPTSKPSIVSSVV